MPKRTIWFTVGATLGATVGVWTKRKIDKTFNNNTPLRVTKQAVQNAVQFTKDVKAAASAGQTEKKIVATHLKKRYMGTIDQN